MPQTAANVIEMPAPVIPNRRKGRLKLTDANVKTFPFQGADDAGAAKREGRGHTFGPEERLPALYYDTEVRGFYVLCHRTSRSFYVQHDIAGQSVAVNLGRVDTISVKDARKAAMSAIVQMKNGINPNDQRKHRKLQAIVDAETDGFTLADAVQLHLYERKKERSEKTIAEYQKVFDSHLKHLMDKPMTFLGANQFIIEELHDQITKCGWDTGTKKARGWKNRKPAPYAANGMVRAFRAVYNYARVKKGHLKLPEFQPFDMNPEHAKESALTLDQLPEWYASVMALPNPIRRDFNLFALFTGNRSAATCEMRWEHVDLTGAANGVPSVFIPTPKGGKAKAFYIPLSDFLVETLRKRRACVATNAAFPDSPWVFPAGDSASGHIEEPAEKRHELLKRFSPHALRHSYATLAQGAGIKLTDISFLMNHRPANLTVAYMRALLPELAKQQQVITGYILSFLAKSGRK